MPARYKAPTTFRLSRSQASEPTIHIATGQTRTVCNRTIRFDGMATAYGDMCPDCRAAAGGRDLTPIPPG